MTSDSNKKNVTSPPYLLVAMPHLQDPNFKHTVVLITEQNSEGTLGFVINRPTTTSLKSVLPSHEQPIPPQVPVWFGGPVGRDVGIILTQCHQSRDKESIGGGLKISNHAETMKELCLYAESYAHNPNQKKSDPGQSLYPFRFLSGHSGWERQQFMDEIHGGYWNQMELDLELVLNTPWNQMWDHAWSKLGLNPVDCAPSSNTYLN